MPILMRKPSRNSYKKEPLNKGLALRALLIILIPLLMAISPIGQSTDSTSLLTAKNSAQGSITTITMTFKEKPPHKGYFNSGEFAFFNTGTDTYTALVGTDLYAKGGRQLIEVSLGDEVGARRRYYPIDVSGGEFGFESFTVAKKMVTPPSKTKSRIADERKLVRGLTSKATEKKLWHGAFELPTNNGDVSSAFGTNRVLNGTKRYRHNGLDLRGQTGKAVFASNRGRVVMTKALYISGNTIAIDHGLGLYTMYSHLSKMTVKVGDVVDKGTVIGEIGATGRVTGPHLHWVAKINGATVSPLELIEATRLISG